MGFVAARFPECCVCTVGHLYRLRHSQDTRGREIVCLQKSRGCVISWAHSGHPPQHWGSPPTLCSQVRCGCSLGSPPKEWLTLFPKYWLVRLTPRCPTPESPPDPGTVPWLLCDSMLFISTAGGLGETRGSSLGFAGNV